MSKTTPSLTDRVNALSASELVDRASTAASTAASNAADFDPIELAHRLGFRSRHAYIGGFASILLAVGSWKASRRKPSDSKSQSDRWASSSVCGRRLSSRSGSHSAPKRMTELVPVS